MGKFCEIKMKTIIQRVRTYATELTLKTPALIVLMRISKNFSRSTFFYLLKGSAVVFFSSHFDKIISNIFMSSVFFCEFTSIKL